MQHRCLPAQYDLFPAHTTIRQFPVPDSHFVPQKDGHTAFTQLLHDIENLLDHDWR